MKPLALLVLLTTTAHAEQWCISRTGRLRLRPADCFTQLGERAYGLGGASGAKSLAVVDRDGDLVGYVAGTTRGYELTYPEVLVFRAVGLDTIGLPVDNHGLVPFGSDLLYYTGPTCTGDPLVPNYGDSRNGLLKVGPVWPTGAWYATGSPITATAGSYVIPPYATAEYTCGEGAHQTPLADGFCCVEDAVGGSWFAATEFVLADAGLEPPFRLNMEP